MIQDKSRLSPRGYFGIREKYNLLSILIILVASLFIRVTILQFENQVDDLSKSAQKLTVASFYEQSNREARALAATLSQSISVPLASGNLGQINDLINTVRGQRDVAYGYLFNNEGRIVADGKPDSLMVGKVFTMDGMGKNALAANDVLLQRKQDLLDVAVPIFDKGTRIGGLRLGFSEKRVKSDILREQKIIASVIRKLGRKALFSPIVISISLMLLGLYFSSRVIALLVKPIIRITEIAREIGKGNLSLKVDIQTGDELEELANSFNQMATGLAKREEELVVLHNSAKALTKNLELDVLVSGGLNTIKEIIRASKGSIMLIKDGYLVVEGVFGWKPGEVVRKRSFSIGEGIAGLAAQRKESILVNDVNNSPFFVKESNKVWRGCQNLLCVPIVLENQLKGVINIQDKVDGAPFIKSDLEYAEIIASSIAISLSNIELVQDKIEKTRMEVELKTAEAVQKTLLPKGDPQNEKIEFASFFDHANETGGDWFGYVEDSQRQKLAVFIGDVSGHGASAALVTAAVNSFIKTLVIIGQRQAQEKTGRAYELFEPANLLKLLNRIVLEIGQRQLAMSFFASALDMETMELRFASAGHNQPYLYRSSKLTFLKVLGPRLGDLEEPEFREGAAKLQRGDTLLWFTDGLIECENTEQEEFGERRLQELLNRVASESADQIKEKVVASVYGFFGKMPIKDDIALIVAKVKA